MLHFSLLQAETCHTECVEAFRISFPSVLRAVRDLKQEVCSNLVYVQCPPHQTGRTLGTNGTPIEINSSNLGSPEPFRKIVSQEMR